ncbi:MAG TPA: Hsp20/alpha crystallin family protein [Candidatus Paceibacterota bacterium]|nr:Hsp20/alpha crystallin family protein [Candidatus Paceibacterota bacterium]
MNIINKKKAEKDPSVANDSHALSLRDAINQMVSESIWDPLNSLELWQHQPLYPKVDISETDKDIKVIADVPGLKPEEIDIDVDEENLTISGKHANETEDQSNKFYRYERQYGEFQRSFVLPNRIKPNEVTADMKDGVLTLVLPKESPTSKQKIKINKAS